MNQFKGNFNEYEIEAVNIEQRDGYTFWSADGVIYVWHKSWKPYHRILGRDIIEVLDLLRREEMMVNARR